MIKEKLKSFLAQTKLEKLPAMMAVSFAILCLVSTSGCLTRAKVQALVWLNNSGSPEFLALCEQTPALKDFGFYRKLDNGQLDFISFCKPAAQQMLTMTEQDFNNLMDQYLPKPKGQ